MVKSKTLVRRGLFHSSFRTELESPITLNSICSMTVTSTKVTIPLFDVEMLETEIFSDFDGIIGCNILKPLGAKIDLNENLLITANAKIPLVYENSTMEYNEDDMTYLDSIVIDINFNEPKVEYLNEKLKT